ncbi:MAG: hypothetical protein JXA28_07065 [Bacteroidetes bacterium]|nr:hypothetical protein [Bacteroidota bacterium]
MKTILLLLVCLSVVAMAMPDVAVACPNCKESYMEEGQSSLASGFNTSILFMMVMPFLVIGGFVLRLWMAQRETHKETSYTQEVP